MTLELNGIAVDCVIGDRPDEREREQRLAVDVSMEVDDKAATSDELADTVDYAALTDRIRIALVSAKCKMIERAAKVVCDVCLSDPKVMAASVRVTKSGAVEHLASASAVYSARGK